MSRTITITLTQAQFEALSQCVSLSEVEDDDFPGNERRGFITARENAWRKIKDAWYAR